MDVMDRAGIGNFNFEDFRFWGRGRGRGREGTERIIDGAGLDCMDFMDRMD